MLHSHLAYFAALGLCAGAHGALDDPRIDESGRDLANYPPPRHFDHLHMKLEIDIPDMGKPMFNGVQTLTVTPIARERGTLTLDAGPLKITSLSVGGRPQKFALEQGKLVIDLNPAIKPGQKADVRIEYSVEYPRANGTGLTWTRGRETARNDTDKAAQIHSQGQADYNHTWFACQDFPNEQLTTELIVTVEDPYIVSSNGHLEGSSFAGVKDGKKRTTWHWLQDKPHCTYLICLNIGRFAIVGLPPEKDIPTRADGQRLECYLYAPLGTEATAQQAYARTPQMVATLSRLFAEPYPWDQYTQALVRRFAAGGMENTSATTMRSSSATSDPGEEDPIIAHELAHQWFGDLLTCKGWEHGWLNEGWASYAEALWEEEDARASGRNVYQAYQRAMMSFLGGQRARNRTYAPDFPPLVSNLYGDTMEPFMKENDIYSKGAVVLHMLRQRLGDEAFWKGVRAYIQKHKHACVETDDFRHALEAASGLSLERFFTQWCDRPGLPRLNIELEWKPGESGDAGTLHIAIDQAQRIDADNPAYALSIPLHIKTGESTEFKYFDIDTRRAELTLPLPAKPTDVVIDPSATVASANRIAKPLSMWLQQIDHESIFAQVQAAEHMADSSDPAAISTLARVAGDDSRLDVVRRAAGASLANHYRRTLESILRTPGRPAAPRRPVLAEAAR